MSLATRTPLALTCTTIPTCPREAPWDRSHHAIEPTAGVPSTPYPCSLSDVRLVLAPFGVSLSPVPSIAE